MEKETLRFPHAKRTGASCEEFFLTRMSPEKNNQIHFALRSEKRKDGKRYVLRES